MLGSNQVVSNKIGIYDEKEGSHRKVYHISHKCHNTYSFVVDFSETSK